MGHTTQFATVSGSELKWTTLRVLSMLLTTPCRSCPVITSISPITVKDHKPKGNMTKNRNTKTKMLMTWWDGKNQTSKLTYKQTTTNNGLIHKWTATKGSLSHNERCYEIKIYKSSVKEGSIFHVFYWRVTSFMSFKVQVIAFID